MKHSYSSISTYINCPFKWAQIYIEGKRFKPNKFALIGQCFHEIIESYLNSRETLLDGYDKYIFDESLKSFNKLQLWLNDLICNNSENTLYIEKQHAVNEHRNTCDFFSDTAKLRGKLDLLILNDTETNIAQLIDFKSGKNPADPLQMYIYSELVFKNYPKVNEIFIQTVYPNIADTRSQYGFRVDEYKLTPENTTNEISTIYDIIDEIEMEYEYKCRPNEYCAWCDFHSECPSMQKTLSIVRTEHSTDLVTKEQAQTAIQMIYLAKSWIQQADTKLKKYVDEHGDIETNEGRYTKSTYIERRFDSGLFKQENPELYEKYRIEHEKTRYELKKNK